MLFYKKMEKVQWNSIDKKQNGTWTIEKEKSPTLRHKHKWKGNCVNTVLYTTIFSLHQGGVVMASQITSTHTIIKPTPLSSYTWHLRLDFQ